MTVLNVWDSGQAVADFDVERARAIVAEYDEPTEKPKRHGELAEVYIRTWLNRRPDQPE